MQIIPYFLISSKYTTLIYNPSFCAVHYLLSQSRNHKLTRLQLLKIPTLDPFHTSEVQRDDSDVCLKLWKGKHFVIWILESPSLPWVSIQSSRPRLKWFESTWNGRGEGITEQVLPVISQQTKHIRLTLSMLYGGLNWFFPERLQIQGRFSRSSSF